jgi:hypothetical protein
LFHGFAGTNHHLSFSSLYAEQNEIKNQDDQIPQTTHQGSSERIQAKYN